MSEKVRVTDLPEAKDIKACVGAYRWRIFVFVASGSCPLAAPAPDRTYCFEMALGDNPAKDACPHFCEVETIDWLVAVKCDHPDAEASYS